MYCGHEAFLDSPVKDSKGAVMGTHRSHYEKAAAKNNSAGARARAMLYDGPQLPDALDYLLEWSRDLHGKSGVGPHGYNPLTYTTIADWSRLTGTTVHPHEVEALIRLDAVFLNPPDLSRRKRGD